MAKSKKYYWLKLKEDFFEEDTIQWLEEQENGKDYCLFYLKLCLKSIKTNGVLIRNVGQMLVPYDVKKLADITNTKADTVIVAMEIFKKIGLVQILENGEIYMAQLENMVGSETTKASLMREKRAKEKLAKEKGNNVTNLLPSGYLDKENCYTEIEKETELELEIRDKELETTTIDTVFSSGSSINYDDLKNFCKQYKFERASRQNIKIILDQFPSWWINEALKIAIFNSNFNLAYVYGILRNWNDDGKTKDISKAEQFKNKSKQGDSFNNFEQRKYSASEISEIEKDLLGWNSNEEEMKE